MQSDGDDDAADPDVTDGWSGNGFALVDHSDGNGVDDHDIENQSIDHDGNDGSAPSGLPVNTGDPDEGIWTDVSEPIDIPDEGPLDPSIFDGLFDDLSEDAGPPQALWRDPGADRGPNRDADPEEADREEAEPASNHSGPRAEETLVGHDLEVAEPTDGDVDPAPDTVPDATAEPRPPTEPPLELDDRRFEAILDPGSREVSPDEFAVLGFEEIAPTDDGLDQRLGFEEIADPLPGRPSAEDGDVEPSGQLAGSLLDAFAPDGTLFGTESSAVPARESPHHDGSSGPVSTSDTVTGPVDRPAEADAIPGETGSRPAEAEAPTSEAGTHPAEVGAREIAVPDRSIEDRSIEDQPIEHQPIEHQQHRTREQADRSLTTSTSDARPPEGPQQPPTVDRRPAGRRWPAFVAAILIGAILGVGGAVVLARVLDRTGESESAAGAEPGLQGQRSGADEPRPGRSAAGGPANEPADVGPIGIADRVASGSLELNTIRFMPGTLNLTESSLMALSELAKAAADAPEEPISIVVRTYSEPTALENQVLSRAQAEAIGDYLVGLGLTPESVRTVGLGAPLLTEAQPVPNFVVASAGLRPSALKTVVQGLNPFAIGIDPTTNQLRPESIGPLSILGQALASDGDGGISLAAYAHSQPDSEANQTLAAAAARAVSEHLVDNFGIEPARISTLTPGQAPYIVSSTTGNHISLHWGRPGSSAAAIAAIDPGAISFQPGSAELEAEAEAALNEVLSIVGPTDETVVIEIHTATEETDSANSALGREQAATIADHLVNAGLAPDRVRVYGKGRLRQFPGRDQASLVVITVLA